MSRMLPGESESPPTTPGESVSLRALFWGAPREPCPQQVSRLDSVSVRKQPGQFDDQP